MLSSSWLAACRIARGLLRARVPYVALLLFVAATCRDATGPQLRPGGTMASAVLNMHPASATLQVGGTVKVTAYFGGSPLNRPSVWTTSDSLVATVAPLGNSNARVTGRGPGTARITATAGPDSGSVLITVPGVVPVRAVVITPDSASLEPGDSVAFGAEPRDGSGNPLSRPVTWSVGDTTIASVSTTGKAIARARGTTRVTATVEGVADTATVTVRQAQLTVPTISAAGTVATGDTLRVIYAVQNLWDTPEADSVIVQVGVRDPSGTVLSAVRRALPRVPGGATVIDTAKLVVTLPVAEWEYVAVAFADCRDAAASTDVGRLTACLSAHTSAGTIVEGDESDNARTAPIAAQFPDLVVQGIAAPDTAFARTMLPVSITITNTGSAVSSNFGVVVAFYDSTNAIQQDSTRRTIQSEQMVMVSGLGAGASRTLQVELEVPVEMDRTHRWEIRAYVDCSIPLSPWASALVACLHAPENFSYVSESDEGNNLFIQPIAVASNVARVELQPDSVVLTALSDTITLTGVAYDRANAVVPNVALSFASLDSGIASLEGRVLRANAGGSTFVVASVDGLADTTAVHVRQTPTALVIEDPGTVYWLGDSVSLGASVFDPRGGVIPGHPVQWTSLDPQVAEMVANGLVVSRATGTARLVATSGVLADTTLLTVTQSPQYVVVVPDTAFLEGVGDTVRLSATALDYNRNVIPGAQVTWTSLDTAGVVVDATGLVTGVRPWVRARVRATVEWWSATAFITVGDSGTTPTPNPAPTWTSFTPHSVMVGSPPPTVIILGTNFISATVIRVNGVDRPTDVVSSTEVRTVLTEADMATAAVLQLAVHNPPPNGGTVGGWINITSPTPTLTALSPAFAMAGAGDTEVTLTGTNYLPQARVLVNGSYSGAVTYVSATELRVTLPASQLTTPRTLGVLVENPLPTTISGHRSGVVNFEVRTPAPILAGLSPAQASAGLAELRLQVTGSNFVSASRVRIDGVDRPTTFINANTLEALLGEPDLRVAGSFPITVFTPAPGGGTSNALDLVLVNGAPTITLLPSSGAQAGRGGFSLTVHGTGFADGAEVLWNGASRPSQYVSSTRITADISAADVAAPGTAQVAVRNPAPGGGTSEAHAMTIRFVGSAVTTGLSSLRLYARDLAWDAAGNRLVVSVRNGAPANANNLVVVDPLTSASTAGGVIGTDPAKLARSHDGQYLYVGVNGANSVRRVLLASLTPDIQWSLPSGEVAGEIEVVPGMNGSVAVSRHRLGFSPSLQGVTMYDNGMARSQSSPGHTGGSRIEFLGSSGTLYGYNNAHTGFEFFTMAVDATGVRHTNATGSLISGFSTNITGASGRIYATDGSIVDAERRVRLGSFGATSLALAVDASLGRAYALTATGITVYDINTRQALGTVPVSGINIGQLATYGVRLVRWGTDGLAFLDEDDLFIVRSPIFAP
jgi:hypothetical protein